jgi:serine/threonine protein kinase
MSKKTEDICKTILGTDEFMSPEVMSNKPYGYEIDMWAFGVVFYYMLNQEIPFSKICFIQN